jgi:dihydrofolate synthase / folylpolyglutamate synthase
VLARPQRSLADWLALQESVHARSIDLGLERVASVARTLGILTPAYRVITVAGTNGKGSTVAFTDAVLRAAGLRVGNFTSPHLVRYNERVRVAGQLASDAELVQAFERIERARGDTTLTFFEYNTLAALLVFTAREVEVAVLEVGLGGRLDATNVIDADVAVLCSVGFDHRDWLGDTLESIGAEKAGILRAGRKAVLGSDAMPGSVFAAIERLGAHAVVAGHDFRWSATDGEFAYHGLRATWTHLARPALPGDFQLRNAATALAACECLDAAPLDAEKVSAALRSVTLPGRFQIVPGAIEWILDVAHNEPAARVLAGELRARPCRGRTWAVCGILTDKDAPAIARALQVTIDEWILCGLPGARGSSAAELAARLDGIIPAPRAAADVARGCELARGLARPADRVLVFGSFATVGPALEWLGLY